MMIDKPRYLTANRSKKITMLMREIDRVHYELEEYVNYGWPQPLSLEIYMNLLHDEIERLIPGVHGVVK